MGVTHCVSSQAGRVAALLRRLSEVERNHRPRYLPLTTHGRMYRLTGRSRNIYDPGLQ
jgi:hypothetical protein